MNGDVFTIEPEHRQAQRLLARCRQYGVPEAELLDDLADLIARATAQEDSESALLRVRGVLAVMRGEMTVHLDRLRDERPFRWRQRRTAERFYEAKAQVCWRVQDAMDPDDSVELKRHG